MALENIVGNIVRGIAVASNLYLTGCGATIRIQDPKNNVWYDCHTNEEYPQEHSCYAAIEAYKARIAASASTTSNRDECTFSSDCSSDESCSSGRCVTRSSNTTQKSGHYVCKKK